MFLKLILCIFRIKKSFIIKKLENNFLSLKIENWIFLENIFKLFSFIFYKLF